MQSKAATVQQYLAELPEDRRAALSAVREVFLKNLDKGYTECMGYGMMGYAVPHSIYPAGYHCDPRQPLPFGGLASQKNYMSLYLMCLYGSPQQEQWFRDAWAKTGKKLDMGKCCIRFKKVEDLALDVIAEAIRRVPVKAYIEHYESAIRSRSSRKPAAKTKAAAKTSSPAKRAPVKRTTNKAKAGSGRPKKTTSKR